MRVNYLNGCHHTTPEVLVACCIALAMFIAVARGAWAAILPRRRRKEVPPDFAPAAHRPAPAHEQNPVVHA